MTPAMRSELCFFFYKTFPAAVIDFFYCYTFLFVLGAWLVFVFACFFHRRFAFSKPLLIFFALFIVSYTVYVFADCVKYVRFLFQTLPQLWAGWFGADNLDDYWELYSTEFPFPAEFESSPYFPLDAGYYDFYENNYLIEDSIYNQLAYSIPVGIACFIYYLAFVISLLRKGFRRTKKGGDAV